MGAAAAPAPSRWRTPEFAVYYVVRALSPLARCTAPWPRLSFAAAQVIARAYVFLLRCGRELTVRLSPPGGASRLPGVRAGLLAGTHVDLSDAQWRTFREALPLLCLVAAASAAIARLVRCARSGPRRHFLTHAITLRAGARAPPRRACAVPRCVRAGVRGCVLPADDQAAAAAAALI
jgi:hypothetical protein